MDTLSHGLYGGIAFGRKSRWGYWLAFFFGIAPDLLSFGVFMVFAWLGIWEHPDWSSGQHPDPAAIPAYVHAAYSVTHSLVIFAVIFALVWIIRRRPLMEMLAWPLHILVDIPTHSDRFFPTPFLWPISDFTVNGYPWSRPEIFIPNVVLLAGLYLWFSVIRPRRQARIQAARERLHL